LKKQNSIQIQLNRIQLTEIEFENVEEKIVA